ncbi:NADP-dependent oxidoreductase [Nocardia terpenica]|uniref:NADP-dependent oxidoreductase n=1 Tax=Nocardia terpenica TaxID=455432 RepID=UPI00189546EA|nr:NADP-dependent oxidoreductase [Nocardia terpenica]MBF6062743.1 NADP-dependent oxidoreductase [Nocardia terpenica]MBF6105122.1 NADP-dependent oxidoreductase [Nocardia terpenica]MBF6112441.1 NADP-dependent oxidoreductase [Nocardia terpenica]MBF6118850.1 NADP-dependent oxidoreductase [Nocardia terpenica]MBF6154319.1 NADP-dependent oxidoreductase [Nocardia terpenica]
MHAMVVREFGGIPESAEMPVPEAGTGRIQIRLAAAGANPVDRKIIDGMLKDHLPHDFPMIPGVDGAGTVSAVGAGVRAFAVGDRVVGRFLTAPVGHGTFADYIAAPANGTIAHIPDELTTVQAAALPTAGLTALDLGDTAELAAGQTVLIVGAAGGVGSFLVQLAATAGTRVIATARPDDTDRMLRLGADEVIDYTAGPLGDAVARAHPDGVDVLFDLVSSPEALTDLLRLVRPGGRVHSVLGAVDEAGLRARGLHGGNIESTGGAPQLRRLLSQAAEGELVIPIAATRPLTDAAQVLGAPGARGKTVLLV